MLYDEYICHYGVKGQRWGVRRYQNYDGTLKPRGEKRLKRDVKDIKYLRDRLPFVKQGNSPKATNRMINEINKNINRSEILSSIRAKTIHENHDLLNNVVSAKKNLQKIMQDAADKSFDDFMNIDKNPEFNKAMGQYVKTISDYNKAQGLNVRTMLGNMGNEIVPGTNLSYSDYVSDIIGLRPNMTLRR